MRAELTELTRQPDCWLIAFQLTRKTNPNALDEFSFLLSQDAAGLKLSNLEFFSELDFLKEEKSQ